MEQTAIQRAQPSQWGISPAISYQKETNHLNEQEHHGRHSLCQTGPWVSLPYCMMHSLTSSAFMTGTEKRSWGIPSLTLWPAGLDKSKISNHFNTRLVSFLDNSKLTVVEVWNKRYWVRASNLACLQFGIKEGTVQSQRAREALRA